jgi:hypothetical protein
LFNNFLFLKKINFFFFSLFWVRDGGLGDGGWSVHPSRDVQASITAMHGIILATDRRQEGSRKQFVTIYFVGESISVGTTNIIHPGNIHPRYAGMHNFWQWGRKSLYATTFVTIIFVGPKVKRDTQKGTFSSSFFMSLYLSPWNKP